jgi:hypothetical protein
MSTTTTQLALTRPEWFQPVPGGSNHYVAAVQNKPGELDALTQASAATWAHMTPLIEVLGPKTPEKMPFKAERVASWVRKLSGAIGARACFLDVLRLPEAHPVTTKDGNRPVLTSIYEEARKRGMRFVPVLRLGSSEAVSDLVRDAALCDGRGVALRYPLLGLALLEGQTPQTVIKEALESVEQVELSSADLIIDLGFLAPDEELLAEDMAPAVHELMGVGPWRSVILLATSMHSTLGGGVVDEGTLGRLPRREWDLWMALRMAGLDQMPTYGDYAVQHPTPPMDGESGGPSLRANIRYTVDDVTLVPRAVGPVIQEGAEQYRDLCRGLVEAPEFAGRDFTWGDRQIAECADGVGDPGSQTKWRGAGTSHHLRHVVEQISRLN